MIIQCPACNLRYDVSTRAPGTRARCRCGASFEVPDPTAVATDNAARCHGCGARNAARARACLYCGASLATASCPACFTLNPAHYRHCSQCGGDLQAPARVLEDERDRQLTCPRCEEALEARLLADTLVDQCSQCGGMFLDHEVLHGVLDDHQRQAPLRQRLLQLPAAADLPDPRQVVYLRCPECATFMNRRNPAHRSGIIVDVCAAHGVWFDDRELAILMQLAGAGATLNVGPRPNVGAAVAAGATGGVNSAAWSALTRDARNRSIGGADLDLGDLGDLVGLLQRLF